MPLKPCYKFVTLRQYLRGGKPLDATKFGIQLNHTGTGGGNLPGTSR